MKKVLALVLSLVMMLSFASVAFAADIADGQVYFGVKDDPIYANPGDEVTVETVVGRLEKGTLIDDAPYYDHSYGKFVPELIEVDKVLRKEMAEIGGDR